MDGGAGFDVEGLNSANPRERVLSTLASTGQIKITDTNAILALIEETDEPFDIALTRLGLVTEEELAACLAAVTGAAVPNNLDEFERLSDLSDLNGAYFKRNRVLPAKRNGVFCALTPDPTNIHAIAALRFVMERPVTIYTITATDFDKLQPLLIVDEPDARGELGVEVNISIEADADRLRDLASAEPAVRLVNQLIRDASEMRASDIHLNPGARACAVRYRVDGALRDAPPIALPAALAAISRFKILSDLDIAERRRPQDGRMSFPIAGRPIDFRLSTTPTVHGESLAVRLLDQKAAPLDLDRLGFTPSIVGLLKRMIAKPNGVILLTGPTGSGKTTTLYTLLTLLVAERKNILTIEDPVEYKLEGVNQTQVNPAIDLTFANALRSFLRHDPDVIMVGEMRDLETAKIAARAALTGHLVLSTLHTNDAPSAITRLLDLGVEDYLIASTLLGVIGQRLVRRRCRDCSGANQHINGSCATCHGDGYSGRTVIAEALEVDDQIRQIIKAGATASDIRAAATRQGFIPMQDDGGEKVLAGVTSAQEINRAVGVYG